ncbi:MAG: sodium/solute symporter [Planctomycetes bacterium]|nr:sodium/solute symporter [Planctomycetota bacterium]
MYSRIDLFVCLGYFIAVAAIGFLSARRQRASVSGYFRAGNQLPWYAIGFSIVAAGISSEQFVGEVGYAYKLGLPVANWEWLVLPALSILLWIFVPLYVRNRIATMPEYLERRFGGRARTLYACLTVASYVLVNFALVFYTGGFALEKMWGINRHAAVWLLALVTGAYTIYGGLAAVAWTGSFQCVLLLGGGLYVFFAGLQKIGWDWSAVLGSGQRAHLFTSADHEVPWTALVVLMLSTNVWYYATNQYINQRCLAARDEWHAKMGVLFSAALQILIPLATCFPGMIYRVLEPGLEKPDGAYPLVVAAVVPEGLRGLVVAAMISAIMSTISGLVNSTSTLVALDLVQRWKGRKWPEARLVRAGQLSGTAALLVGALLAPLVMKWENLFRYAQDIWAPMAAPVVVVFLAGALWPGARERGALLCLWMAVLSAPLVLAKAVLADAGIHFLPENLENAMVLAIAVALMAIVSMALFSSRLPLGGSIPGAAVAGALILSLAAWSPSASAMALLFASLGLVIPLLIARRAPAENLWDRSMLATAGDFRGWRSLWLWWGALAAVLLAIYIWLW